MKIEKIKPIPKYIIKEIKKADDQNNVCIPGRTRFYSYLTKNDGELVKVTVAVKTRYKQWLYKQVAVHGINSDCLCFRPTISLRNSVLNCFTFTYLRPAVLVLRAHIHLIERAFCPLLSIRLLLRIACIDT